MHHARDNNNRRRGARARDKSVTPVENRIAVFIIYYSHSRMILLYPFLHLSYSYSPTHARTHNVRVV